MNEIIVAIHQPAFLPWLGFWCKYCLSDRFYIMEEVMPPNRGTLTRVRIGRDESQWLSVPVCNSAKSFVDLKLDNPHKNLARIAKTIKHSYPQKRYPYYYRAYELADIIAQHETLSYSHLACKLLLRITQMLGQPNKTQLNLNIPIKKWDIPEDVTPTARLMKITELMYGTAYLAGRGGLNYMNMEEIPKHIDLWVQDISNIKYRGSILETLASVEYVGDYISDIARKEPFPRDKVNEEPKHI